MGFGTTPEGSDSIPLSSGYVRTDGGTYVISARYKTNDGSNNSAIIEVAPLDSATATLSNVGASVTSVTVLALNVLRRGMEIFNDSSAMMYLRKGAGASSTSFSTKVPPQALYEMPISPIYTGIFTAAWDSATGSARITELT